MNKKKISLIFLAIFIIGILFSGANLLLNDNGSETTENGTLTVIDSKTNESRNVSFEKSGKCLDVYDGNTIWVYGVGKVQLIQVGIPKQNEAGFSEAKQFTQDLCLGNTVYLDIDDKNPKDKYDRTLALMILMATGLCRGSVTTSCASHLM